MIKYTKKNILLRDLKFKIYVVIQKNEKLKKR